MKFTLLTKIIDFNKALKTVSFTDSELEQILPHIKTVIKYGSTSLLELLLNKNKSNLPTKKLFVLACKEDQREAIELLIKYLNVDADMIKAGIHQALNAENIDLIKYLQQVAVQKKLILRDSTTNKSLPDWSLKSLCLADISPIFERTYQNTENKKLLEMIKADKVPSLFEIITLSHRAVVDEDFDHLTYLVKEYLPTLEPDMRLDYLVTLIKTAYSHHKFNMLQHLAEIYKTELSDTNSSRNVYLGEKTLREFADKKIGKMSIEIFFSIANVIKDTMIKEDKLNNKDEHKAYWMNCQKRWLTYALIDENYDIANYLISQNAVIEKTKIIRLAVDHGQVDVIFWLLNNGVDRKELPEVWQRVLGSTPLEHLSKIEIYKHIGKGLNCWKIIYGNEPPDPILADYSPVGFNLNVYKQLLEYTLVAAELENGNPTSYFDLEGNEYDGNRVAAMIYAYKLAVLFQDFSTALRYVETYFNDAKQPIHDACVFELPKYGMWEPRQWRDLMLTEGPQLFKCLPRAVEIEKFLNQAPNNLIEAEEALLIGSYARTNENPQLAELCVSHGANEETFDKCLEILANPDRKKADVLPNINISASELGAKHYHMTKLSPDDMRGFLLGDDSVCCQSIGKPGERYARHGMISKYGGFLISEKQISHTHREKYEKLLSIVANSKSIEEIISAVPDREQRRSFKELISMYEKIYNNPKFGWQKKITQEDFIKERISNYIKRKYLTSQIIAQSWAWLASDHRTVVADSWESRRPEVDNKYCQRFMEKASEQAFDQGFLMCLGAGGKTPTDLNFFKLFESKTPIDYSEPRDSLNQYFVFSPQLLVRMIAIMATYKKTDMRKIIYLAITWLIRNADVKTSKNYIEEIINIYEGKTNLPSEKLDQSFHDHIIGFFESIIKRQGTEPPLHESIKLDIPEISSLLIEHNIGID